MHSKLFASVCLLYSRIWARLARQDKIIHKKMTILAPFFMRGVLRLLESRPNVPIAFLVDHSLVVIGSRSSLYDSQP